jgi:hypothetical protein
VPTATKPFSDRRFGVEIEHGVEIPRDWYASRDYGEAEDYIAEKLVAAGLSNDWAGNIGYDGTLLEVRSPILQGEEGMQELKLAMDTIRDAGGYVTLADGMHVHHDAPEFREDAELRMRAIESWAEVQDLIDPLVIENRRYNGYCSKVGKAEVAMMKRNVERYRQTHPRVAEQYLHSGGAFSTGSLTYHGSIEIRYHEGCLNPDKAAAWIRFGQAFLEGVLSRKRVLKCSGDTYSLARLLKVRKRDIDTLIELSAADTRPARGGYDDHGYDDDDYCPECDSYACWCW